MVERILVINHTPDPADFVKRYAEQNKDWPYAELVTNLYPKIEIVKQRFFDGVFKPWDLSRLPMPPIAIEDMRNWKYLASYHLVKDGYGFSDKLTLNEKHFKKDEYGNWVWDYGGEWGLWETIIHEMAHEACVRRNLARDHSKPFTDMLLQLGIYCNERGQHYQIADPDKPFGILMREWFVKRPSEEDFVSEMPEKPISWWFLFSDETEREKKGKSTLSKWVCPECGISVRIGIKGNPEIVHEPCSAKKSKKVFFVRSR